jgi:hypothetical protein
VQNYNNKFGKLLESYGSIVLKKRMFYPRNFNLSEGFTKSLKVEIERLKKEGISESKIIEKLSKCIRFHC